MSEFILVNESNLRIGFFLGFFMLLGMAESLFPRRKRMLSRLRRWSNNLAIVLIDWLALRLCFPLLAAGLALMAEQRSWGLLNILEVAAPVAILLSIVLMDLAIYAQHVLFHRVPLLWRIHRMHHSDLDLDVTSGIRFHPIEIVLSMLIKMALVLLLGPPAVAVILFEILLNASALFNHSNLRLGRRPDEILRRVLVTPDMHRVHHSVIPRETNSNYGFFLPWWDRCFGTYRAQPEQGHEGMTIGLENFRTNRDARIDRLLLQPLENK